MELIIEPDRRFVNVREYCRRTGLSYSTVMSGIKKGQIFAVQTEGGHWRVDTWPKGLDEREVMRQLHDQNAMLKALCRQFNVPV